MKLSKVNIELIVKAIILELVGGMCSFKRTLK